MNFLHEKRSELPKRFFRHNTLQKSFTSLLLSFNNRSAFKKLLGLINIKLAILKHTWKTSIFGSINFLSLMNQLRRYLHRTYFLPGNFESRTKLLEFLFIFRKAGFVPWWIVASGCRGLWTTETSGMRKYEQLSESNGVRYIIITEWLWWIEMVFIPAWSDEGFITLKPGNMSGIGLYT